MIARLILLLLFIPTLAFARSGGSFGGGFNSSKSSSPAKSYSTPARSYSAPSRVFSTPSRPWAAPSQARSVPTTPAKTWSTPSVPRRVYVPSRATSTRESHDGLATLVGIGIGYGLRHAQSRPAMVHVPVTYSSAPSPVYTHTYDPNFVGPVLPAQPVGHSNNGWGFLGFLVFVGAGGFIAFILLRKP